MIADKTILVRPMGAKPIVLRVMKDATVSDVLKQARVSQDGSFSILGDGEEVQLTDSIGEIEELVIVPSVKGGTKN